MACRRPEWTLRSRFLVYTCHRRSAIFTFAWTLLELFDFQIHICTRIGAQTKSIILPSPQSFRLGPYGASLYVRVRPSAGFVYLPRGQRFLWLAVGPAAWRVLCCKGTCQRRTMAPSRYTLTHPLPHPASAHDQGITGDCSGKLANRILRKASALAGRWWFPWVVALGSGDVAHKGTLY